MARRTEIEMTQLEGAVENILQPTRLDLPASSLSGRTPQPAASPVWWRPARLLGRKEETEMLDRFRADVRGGTSRALVVHGAAGIGKTALLAYVADTAGDCRVLSVAGVQAEMEFGFSALHQLCIPVLDHLDRLPAPQRDALNVTLGFEAGPVPDRLLVGMAVLSLLADVAAQQPLMCLIDDEQWLDRASAQVLSFVARRLGSESVGMLFAARTPSAELAGLAQLPVTHLGDDDAQVLLDSVLTGPVEQQIRDRIVAETGGNPLALLELPRGLTAAELAGRFGTPAPALQGHGVEESFLRRADALAPGARLLLLVAAAEPLGDPLLVRRAATLLGISSAALRAVADAGLVEIGSRVRFRHPLARSAVYRAAAAQDRQQVHRALAEATDPAIDPDRHAWHRGQAASGPDEAVASQLERSAERAEARGGLAAGAAFLARAATLTPDPAQRARRALAAARASHHAGTADGALALLTLAEAGPYDEAQRAQSDSLRAQVSFSMTRGGDAISLLLDAARRLEPVNARLAADTYLDALMAAMFAGHLAGGDTLTETAKAALKTELGPADDLLPADLLRHGLAVRFTDGYQAAMPLLRSAVDAFNDRAIQPEQLRWLWLAHIVAGHLWDERTLDTVHHVDLARSSGALATLPLALATRMGAHVLMGELPAAAVLLEATQAVTESTGIPSAPYGALLLAAWQGDESEVLALVHDTKSEAVRRREGFALIIAGFAEAMLYNSLGRYEQAASAAQVARGYPPAMGVEPWNLLVEFIEGASRSGQSAAATAAFQDLVVTTQAAGSEWALGIEARSRALLSTGSEAEAAYTEAICRLGKTMIRGECARAHLLYGEWLRRDRRKAEARSQLRTAHQMFIEMEMGAFAARAARELRATGAIARARNRSKPCDLTSQESEVARLASEGLSNPEIASRLFISARTVQYHLRKVFTKMDITSRSQLAGALKRGHTATTSPESHS